MRHGRGALLALGIAGAVIASAGPVASVEPFGPTALIPQAGRSCAARVVAADSAGTVRGLAACDRTDQYGQRQYDQLAYVELRNGRWTTSLLPRVGRPLAAAQDATGTYLLYESHDPAAGLGATLLKRSTTGQYTARRLGPQNTANAATVVARDGKWWAVWAVPGSGADGDRSHNLFEAGTLLGNTAARPLTNTTDNDFYPSLALRPAGGLVLAWDRITPGAQETVNDIRIAVNTGAGWSSRSLAKTSSDSSVDLTTDGRHVFAFFLLGHQPVVASDESGVLRQHRFVTRSCAVSGAVAASAGNLTAVFSQCTGNGGSALVAVERRAGRWTTATLYSGPGQRIAQDVVSVRGRATALFASGLQTYSRSQ